MKSTWDDEQRVEDLRRLWAEGHSARTIAQMLGISSRNSVISKVHRLGLAQRATTITVRQKPKQQKPKPWKRFEFAKRQAAPLLAADSYVPPAEELVIPLAERKTVLTLTESSCRWPIGDPLKPDFHFCGKGKIPGLSYCEVHARRAYEPPKPRRRESDFHPDPSAPAAAPVPELEAAELQAA